MGALQEQIIESQVIPFNKNDRYKKSNLLISSKASSSLFENQLLALATQALVETQDGQIKSTMAASEIKKLLGKNYSQAYEELKKASLRLKSNFIMIEDPENNRFQVSNLISDCTYDNGVFTINWNQTLRKAIIAMKGYTLLSLSSMLSWKSNVTFRLYECLRSECYTPKGYKNEGNIYEKTYNLSELKITLGCINLSDEKVGLIANKYNKSPDYDKMLSEVEELAKKEPKLKPKWRRWSDFEVQVLKKACEEMNHSEKSDLHVIQYTPIRVGIGGKVTGVRFVMELLDSTQTVSTPQILSEDEKFAFIDEIMDIIEAPLKIKDLKAIAEAAEYDIEKVKKAVAVLNNSSVQINGVTGFLISAIRNDYEQVPTKSKKENSFGGFNQRDYDYDALTKEMLGE